MTEKELNAAVDKFIRNVGFTAHNELKKNVRAALKSGKLKGQRSLAAAITVSSEMIGLDVTIHSKIDL